ncbi:DNA invertase Pin-like site-specific DNA recombinase [Anaerobacterium chartisolvens]|uniref:DNA invertase Pin-like site-specific DNA recombinase n=1 Tax=Anaerobacterium chartisolvens TaxID=1297424 RepID=A0A369BI38_9FIRM|nr:recombinase family protein [Anaerobacterium chartisolvens]RCX20925.1 DNA invertase Pin-like site-specific DNA recombinase [Anaerobacterium chartisolvens]
MKIDIYLRKSRADEELEKKLGEGETLARHRRALLKIVKERGYFVANIHEELVSGEELFFRPAMLELLKDVEQKQCEAVLVMDIQRLGRGDMEEQGIILKTFKRAGVKIITPKKTYDLNDEFDEEYSEFEAFMSRKEYKMINRRMQGGRIRSVEEGNYIATRPPYGYDVTKINKNTRTLVPNPEQSEVIRMLFDWYVNKHMGCSKIASELNLLGIKSYTGGKWERTTISNFLKNPVYIGKVVWKKKCIRKSKSPDKKKDTYTRNKSDWIVSDGKHVPIVEQELYDKAQDILASRYHVPYQLVNGIVNPLAGLVICGVCGSKMKRRPYGDSAPHLVCESKCGVKSNKFESVENAVIAILQEYMSGIKTSALEEAVREKTDLRPLENNKSLLEKELKTLETQRLRTFDLLEQGVYDSATFAERSNYISLRTTEVQTAINACDDEMEKLQQQQNVAGQFQEIQNVLDVYPGLQEPKEKNILLKDIIEKIVYYKEKGWKSDEFNLKVFPKALSRPLSAKRTT